MRREADVVTYAAIHLTHTVNMALGSFFKDAVESVSEVNAEGCRPDFIWRVAGSEEAKQAFAILEMKATGGVDPAVFEDATEANADAAGQEGDDGVTLFKYKGKEYKPIKQITAYAQSNGFNTRYLALFDGHYLFLGVFSEGKSSLGIPLLSGTLIPCHGKEVCHARKALLGWLIEAKLEKEKGRNNSLGRFPKQMPARGYAHRTE